MKSRIRSHSKSDWRLNSSIVAWSVCAVGKQPDEADRGRLDEVDAGRIPAARGSRPASPSATQLRFHILRRLPLVKRSRLGLASCSPSRLASSSVSAASSSMCLLE